jgi:hypothetical protein
MIKVIALIVLVVIVLLVSIPCVVREYSMRNRYIRRDYTKFLQLDAQLEQRSNSPERSSREHHPDIMS